MSPLETIALRQFKDEMREEFQGLRTELAPALELAQNVRRLTNAIGAVADAIAGMAKFLKWGVGIGAGAATIYIALHAAGLA